MQFLTKNALALSALALLVTFWRAWFDPVLGHWGDYIKTEGGIFAMTLGYTVAIAGWAYALHAATRGSRRGFIAAFALNVIVWFGLPVLQSVYFCPGICANAGITFNAVNLSSLLLGLLAIVGMAASLRSSRA